MYPTLDTGLSAETVSKRVLCCSNFLDNDFISGYGGLILSIAAAAFNVGSADDDDDDCRKKAIEL